MTGKTTIELAKELGVTPITISKRIQDFGDPYRESDTATAKATRGTQRAEHHWTETKQAGVVRGTKEGWLSPRHPDYYTWRYNTFKNTAQPVAMTKQETQTMTAMNEFFEMQEDTTTTAPTHREIYYSMGVNTGSTQYINIWRRNDELFIREVCKAFIESVRINKDNNAVHKQFYKEVFQDAQSSLPKPDRKRTGLTHNTYASFVNGIEENFEKGTRNYN
jgi:hypothetical protein